MITDPQAIRFCNEVVRPLAEKLRAVKAEIKAAETTWFGGVNNLFPNDSTAVDDGREAEGASRLTGANVNSLIGDVLAASAAMNDGNIDKPCVRPLSAS